VEHRAEGYHSGADHFLPKPFELEELLAIVERAVERNQPLSYAAPLLHALHDRVELADMPQVGEALSLLGEFQQRMLPPGEVHLGHLSAGACLLPSQIASGDFYDYLPWNEGRSLGFLVGDVSGRGLAAAYFMVMVRTALRVLARNQGRLADTVAALNETLVAETPPGWFVTLFYGVADPWRCELRYVNAGHCPAAVCPTDGPLRLLETTGPALGLFPNHVFQERTVALHSGDHLVCATDGVLDAVLSDDPQERYAWIARVVADLRDDSVTAIATALVEGARRDAEGRHKDDLTALVLRHD
jgi:sigma-B regulation protein RsbU (phosphoserine phosphatase)